MFVKFEVAEQEAAGNSSFDPESSAIQMICGRPTLHSGAIGTNHHHHQGYPRDGFLFNTPLFSLSLGYGKGKI
ncbi:unnamed protein product [Chironomus riparius]|uniref:Uncharacterized protein n=1 Tax=Chironomus riparius TaxID=315576 RepID=A0A9N9S014_9DIPT|nr:unnamed protein product [Chironomus riparius]